MEANDQQNSTVPKPVESRQGTPFWNWKIFVALIAVVILFFTFRSRHANAHPEADSTAITVTVARVTRENLAQEQSFEAEFRPYQEIDLHAKVAGFVSNINVDIGDQVHQGDVLATLEIPELKEEIQKAEAQQLRNEKEIKRATATYDDAHLGYTRLMKVSKTKPNLVAQQELDTALAHDSAADATLSVAQQEVAVSKAEVSRLKAMQDYCTITAPFTGIITKRYADQGTLVQGGVGSSSGGLPLVRLSQNDHLRLDFPVELSYVERIKVGEPVEIRIAALNRTLQGKISRFARRVNTETRKMEAEVDVPNPDFILTPGIYAIAAMKLEHRENALAVPVDAIANRRSPTLFVLNKDNQIDERPVTLGLETADKIEIATGVSENDLVMIGSRAEVKPGQKVQPKITDIGSAK